MKRGIALWLLLASALGAFYEWGGPARRGVRELRARRYERALEALRAARAGSPQSAVIPYDEALVHASRGEADSAQALYQEAITLRGDRARASAAYNLGNGSMRGNRFGEAARLYREALRIEPKDGDTKRNLEEAIRRLRGQPPSARRSGGGSGPPMPNLGSNHSPSQRSGSEGSQAKTPPRGGAEFTRQEAEQWLQALESERRASRREGGRRAEEETGKRDW